MWLWSNCFLLNGVVNKEEFCCLGEVKIIDQQNAILISYGKISNSKWGLKIVQYKLSATSFNVIVLCGTT